MRAADSERSTTHRNETRQPMMRWASHACRVVLLAVVIWLGEPVRPLVSAETAATTTTERICFVFSGSRASEIEPCGCHDKQTGGVDREAYLYEQLRKTYPNLVGMDAGGWTDSFQTANERLKTDYLIRALREMRFNVFNVTPYDLIFGTSYPMQLAENGVGRLLSANVVSRSFDKAAGTTSTKQVFAPFTILEVPRKDGRRAVRVGVIGISDRGSLEPGAVQRLRNALRQRLDFEVLDSTEVLKTLIPMVRKQADYVIVLALMDRAVAQRVAGQFEGVDLLVTTWGVQSLRMFMHIGKVTLVNTGFYGRYFVQGFVDFDAENRPIGLTGGMVDIASEGPAATSFAKLLEEYRENTKDLDRQIAVAREQSRYTGRNECIRCHNSEYLQWTRTPHNLAFSTLIQKNQHYNPDCLPCHVTGYGDADGFVDNMQTGHLVSVQCESCHGPARAHVRVLAEIMKPDASGKVKRPTLQDPYPHLPALTSEPVCLKCHDKEHDPNFNYERDYLLSLHTNMNGPFRRQLPAQATAAAISGAPMPVSVVPMSGVPLPMSPSAPARRTPPPLTPSRWATVK